MNEEKKVTSTTTTQPVDVTKAQIITKVTQEYIAKHPVLPDPKTCAEEVVLAINMQIQFENAVRPKGEKLPSLNDLPPVSIAFLMAARPDIALVAPGDKSQMQRKKGYTEEQKYQMLIVNYQRDGWNKGVWEPANNPKGAFGKLAEEYKPDISIRDKTEVYTLIKSKLRIIEKCVIPHYVPVNNGIVDTLNKQLLPFSPDIVFTAKIHTDLNMAAANPIIHIPEDGSDWDVDSWFASLGSPSFVESIKEVIQAACLPLAPRDKMCLFYNKAGNNGKGTICQLIRNLLGEEVVKNITIKGFSERFGLANLPDAMAVIVDENDVNSYNKGLANLKSAITGDKLTIEAKFQNMFDYTFNGLILQCVNDFPNVDDKTGSFKRRLHILTFENCFTGCQKRYIKNRLIYREDVLEYILKTVLIDMDYRDEFTETAETKATLKMYTVATNSVTAFLGEILPECKWDLLPATDFLYDAYKHWYKQISPSGKVIGRNEFIDSVKEYVATDPDTSAVWEWTDSTRSQGYIDCSVREPLLVEYDLVAFQDDMYSSGSVYKEYACQRKLKSKYSGLKRRTTATTGNTGVTNIDATDLTTGEGM